MIAPRLIPIASMRKMTAQAFQPSRSNTAEATVVSATTPLTERSIPPVRITNVMPMPLIKR